MITRRNNQLFPSSSAQLPVTGKALLWRLLGSVLAVVALVLAIMNWEVVWEVFSEGIMLALEAGEEALDTAFEAIGLNPALSQMATAYTGFVLALVLLYFLIRKTMRFAQSLQKNIALYREAYGVAYSRWHEQKREMILQWWETLDWMQRIAVVTGLFLVGIPLALLASFVLGELVTMFIP